MHRRDLSPGMPGSSSRTMREIGLSLYAALAALVLVRSLFLTIGVRDTLWVGHFVYRVTDLLVFPFSVIPGSDLTLIGLFTLADLALLALTAAVPFAILSLGRNRVA